MRSTVILLLATILFGTEANCQAYPNYYLDTMDISVNEINDRYQPSRKKLIDIEHIRLELKPFFEQKSLYGKAFLNIKAYNLPIKHVELDAKGMDIRQVFIIHPDGFIAVDYTYDNLILNVQLNKEYHKDEQFTLFIEYLAQPYKLEDKGINLSAGRGMFFIDPFDKNPMKPTHIWTQGETNANSVWFPTIDAPNEQFTQDLFITVDPTYSTLSNGMLVGSELNPDGSRTDHWEQRKPHGPHLVMMAVGKFHVSLDDWGPIQLTYLTEPEYARDVRKIFGNTPYMISYFSRLFQMDFPWDKYAQLVVHDFNAAAMENTSAVIMYDAYFADRYDVLDRNYEETIVHELVHQWFGNLVACESWAHLALNESFATYGEYLWYDYKYSRDHADYLQHEYLFEYLLESRYKSEPIVNYYYDDAEDLFDAHRYEKGSCVLHMLRDYLGDQLFFDGLHLYLKDFKYRSAEMADLRQSLEKVSGEDLYWFFDQWFMKKGHPVVAISHDYDKSNREVVVTIKQEQDISEHTTYQFPLAIDIYQADTTIRHFVWVNDRKEKFAFPSNEAPQLVNVDAKKIMLWEKEDDKDIRELIYQYNNAPLYADRLEALSGLRDHQDEPRVRSLYLEAMKDGFFHIRRYALRQVNLEQYHAQEGSIEKIQELALKDKDARVRKEALNTLAGFKAQYAIAVSDSLFHQDSSRNVIATALSILYATDQTAYYQKASQFEFEHSFQLVNTIAAIYAEMGDQSKHEFFKRKIWRMRPYFVGPIIESYIIYLERMDIATIDDAAAFLIDLVLYEETEHKKVLAKNALFDLQEFFAKSKSVADDEKAGILKKAIERL